MLTELSLCTCSRSPSVMAGDVAARRSVLGSAPIQSMRRSATMPLQQETHRLSQLTPLAPPLTPPTLATDPQQEDTIGQAWPAQVNDCSSLVSQAGIEGCWLALCLYYHWELKLKSFLFCIVSIISRTDDLISDFAIRLTGWWNFIIGYSAKVK